MRPRIELLIEEMASTVDRVGSAQAEAVGLRRDLFSYLEVLSFGLDLSAASVPRFAELSVYASESRAAVVLEDSALALVEEFGFVAVDEFPPVRQSFLKRLTLRSRKRASLPEFEKQIEAIGNEFERAVQIAKLDLPQAEADSLQLGAVAQVLAAIADVPKASVRVGSVAIIKDHDEVRVQQLTHVEMLRISREPTMLGTLEQVDQDTSEDGGDPA